MSFSWWGPGDGGGETPKGMKKIICNQPDGEARFSEGKRGGMLLPYGGTVGKQWGGGQRGAT